MRKVYTNSEPRPGDLIKAQSTLSSTYPYVGGTEEVFGIFIQKFKKRHIGHMPTYAYQLFVEGTRREFDSEFWEFEIVNFCRKKYY